MSIACSGKAGTPELGFLELGDEVGPDRPGGAARVGGGDDGGLGRRAGGAALLGLACGRLVGDEVGRADRRGIGAERERGGDPAAVHDGAGGDHRHLDPVGDLGEQREEADEVLRRIAKERAPVAAGFAALGDHRVDARRLERGRLVGGGRGSDHDGLGGLQRREVRNTEGE